MFSQNKFYMLAGLFLMILLCGSAFAQEQIEQRPAKVVKVDTWLIQVKTDALPSRGLEQLAPDTAEILPEHLAMLILNNPEAGRLVSSTTHICTERIQTTDSVHLQRYVKRTRTHFLPRGNEREQITENIFEPYDEGLTISLMLNEYKENIIPLQININYNGFIPNTEYEESPPTTVSFSTNQTLRLVDRKTKIVDKQKLGDISMFLIMKATELGVVNIPD